MTGIKENYKLDASFIALFMISSNEWCINLKNNKID
jgi:hypothetical protein